MSTPDDQVARDVLDSLVRIFGADLMSYPVGQDRWLAVSAQVRHIIAENERLTRVLGVRDQCIHDITMVAAGRMGTGKVERLEAEIRAAHQGVDEALEPLLHSSDPRDPPERVLVERTLYLASQQLAVLLPENHRCPGSDEEGQTLHVFTSAVDGGHCGRCGHGHK